MRAIIISGGAYFDAKKHIGEGDVVFAADSGYDNAVRMGVRVDYLIGDLDSIKTKPSPETKVMTFPTDKDASDTQLCVEYAKKLGASEVVLVCALGGRVDHMLGNLMLGVTVIDEKQKIFTVADQLVLNEVVGTTVSLIALEESEVTLTGFKWLLKNEKLEVGSTQGLSNVVVCVEQKITVHNGKVVCVVI